MKGLLSLAALFTLGLERWPLCLRKVDFAFTRIHNRLNFKDGTTYRAASIRARLIPCHATVVVEVVATAELEEALLGHVV